MIDPRPSSKARLAALADGSLSGRRARAYPRARGPLPGAGAGARGADGRPRADRFATGARTGCAARRGTRDDRPLPCQWPRPAAPPSLGCARGCPVGLSGHRGRRALALSIGLHSTVTPSFSEAAAQTRLPPVPARPVRAPATPGSGRLAGLGDLPLLGRPLRLARDRRAQVNDPRARGDDRLLRRSEQPAHRRLYDRGRPTAAHQRRQHPRAGRLPVYRVVSIGGAPVVTWLRAGHTCVLAGSGAVTSATLLKLAAWPEPARGRRQLRRRRHPAHPLGHRQAGQRVGEPLAAGTEFEVELQPPGSGRSAAASTCSRQRLRSS